MSTFRNNNNNQNVEINQDTLTEFKNWLNNDPDPIIGHTDFTVAKDIPFNALVPYDTENRAKINTLAIILLHEIYHDNSRMNELFDLAAIAPQIPLQTYNFAGQGTGDYYSYEKIVKTLESRPMSDNLILAANAKTDTEYHFPGQPENITTLSPEKRNALNDILESNDWSKIQFLNQIFARGDLLNYNGLNNDQRKRAARAYANAQYKQNKNGIRETILHLDEKYLTIDILKEILIRKTTNYNDKELLDYNDIKFELSNKEKKHGYIASYRPQSSGEYAKEDTSKAKTQAEKNVNILPEDYIKVRDIFIKEAIKRNKASANAGFKDICCQLFDTKSYQDIPARAIVGLLADVNLKTAQYDVSHGKTQNLSGEALQMVLDTDKSGYYSRKITPQDIAVVNRYSEKIKVSPSPLTEGLINRETILNIDDYELRKFQPDSNKFAKLTIKEKQALLARSETAFKAEKCSFRLEGIDQKQSFQFAILASNAVQQKQDFSPEQKAELKKLTRENYSAQDILNLLNTQYENYKNITKQRVDNYGKIQAITDYCANEALYHNSAAEKIKTLQQTYKKLQSCTKNQNFEAKDEQPFNPENVEHLITEQLNGKEQHLPMLEKPSFLSSMFAPRKEEDRQKFNSAIKDFNEALHALTKAPHNYTLQQITLLKKESGHLLAPETLERAQKSASAKNKQKENISELSEKYNYSVGLYMFPHQNIQNEQNLANEIFEAAPVPVSDLKTTTATKDKGIAISEILTEIEHGEQIFSNARHILTTDLEGKRQAQNVVLEQEAEKQEQQKSEKIKARTRTVKEKLRTNGNNMLLEQIDINIAKKEQKKAEKPKTFDPLAMKAAIKAKEAQK